MKEVRYYRVNTANKRAYWCPSPVMKGYGFEVTALGFDGPAAREAAEQLNERWQMIRKDPERAALGIQKIPETNGQFVYFLRVAERIKIGTSRTPFGRLADLAQSLPDKISNAVVVRGTRADEQRLHRRFRAYRTRGEWFVASHPVQLTMMRSAAAGTVVHDGVEDERRTKS